MINKIKEMVAKNMPLIVVLAIGFMIGYQFGVYSKNAELGDVIQRLTNENELLKWVVNQRSNNEK